MHVVAQPFIMREPPAAGPARHPDTPTRGGPTIKIGRLLYALIFLLGLAVAARQLRELQVPLLEVAGTGVLFLVALAALFGLLLGMGKLLGWLTRR